MLKFKQFLSAVSVGINSCPQRELCPQKLMSSQGWLTSPPVLVTTAQWKQTWSLELWGTGPWRTQSLNCIVQTYTFLSLLFLLHLWKWRYFFIQQFKNSSEVSSYVVQQFIFKRKK